jgi:hypothetical protein
MTMWLPGCGYEAGDQRRGAGEWLRVEHVRAAEAEPCSETYEEFRVRDVAPEKQQR